MQIDALVRPRSVAIVGATGAVGRELLGVLERRQFPLAELRLYASPRSAGTLLQFQGRDIAVTALTEESFAGVDLALFSAGSGTARDYAPVAVRSGAVVIDNSSAFRMDPAVPLVVPEMIAGSFWPVMSKVSVVVAVAPEESCAV